VRAYAKGRRGIATTPHESVALLVNHVAYRRIFGKSAFDLDARNSRRRPAVNRSGRTRLGLAAGQRAGARVRWTAVDSRLAAREDARSDQKHAGAHGAHGAGTQTRSGVRNRMSAERALELAVTDVTTTRGTRNQHYIDQYPVVKDSVNRGLTVRC
jgi:hypothetical protein